VTGDCSRVVPGSGIDLDFFSFAPLPADPLRFLLVGRMLRDKGVREYVDAARSLRADFPQLRFQLLGGIDEGNRSAIPRAEIDAWVAEGLVDYLGRTSDVRPFLAASTIVVLPSYREGLPRTLLEAAAMGRPLLATNVPGCREVVEHGVNGIVCEARDSVSLAAAMKAYVRLPRPSLEAMGAASRHKVREQFGTECVVSAYLEVLDSMEPA
jgi:glycosyltransferase involved in cell wall biosynthesis